MKSLIALVLRIDTIAESKTSENYKFEIHIFIDLWLLPVELELHFNSVCILKRVFLT